MQNLNLDEFWEEKRFDVAHLEGEEAKEFSKKLELENAERVAKVLKEAKTEAATRGKETFDLTALMQLYNASKHTQQELELKYYVYNSEVMTISEFAKLIEHLDSWNYGY